ncbi:DNA polymerase III subunit gamma and tau [Serinicoccus sediminis]|uniref:DNA polymerase III subunit gamma and tau n=1 Tax=Serinicoccus sediminis TaxID=2306021 RepID=UPI00192E1456|nr:DNA polymerase III subunit gamma and tau [Serinicoccus sediminis]
MSIALYRRYRPETFADVIGQEHVTEPLMQALRSERVSHAYLFSGPRGCGKTTSARILARCLNCEQGPTPEPCGTCESCVALARDGAGSVDVIEIDAASHGRVDDTRELRERAAFGPATSRYKIYIIDEAHMVSREGFNSLLKVVEEPPPHVKFIFATTEPEKVLATIRSRTHHYPFHLVPPQRLTAYLEQLCKAEGVHLEPGVLSFVTRAGGGSVRDSLSVLDQLISGAGEDGLTYERTAALLGFTDVELLDAVVEALAAGDAATVFAQVDRVMESGHDPRRFVEDLLERYRDLIVLAAVGDQAGGLLPGLPADQVERMRRQAQAHGAAGLSRSADLVSRGLSEMTGAVSYRLVLELLAARLLLPAAQGEEGHGARLDRIERRLGAGGAPSAGVPAGPSQPGTGDSPGEERGGDARPTPRQAAMAAVRGGDRQETPGARGPAAEPGGESPQDAASGRAPDATGPAQPQRDGSPGAGSPGGGPAEPQQPGSPQQAPGHLDTAALRRHWPEIITAVRSISRRTAGALESIQVVDFDGRRLLVGMPDERWIRHFMGTSNEEALRQGVLDALALDTRIEATVLGGGGGGSTAVTGDTPGGGPATGRPVGSTPPDGTPGPAGGRPSTDGTPPQGRGPEDTSASPRGDEGGARPRQSAPGHGPQGTGPSAQDASPDSPQPPEDEPERAPEEPPEPDDWAPPEDLGEPAHGGAPHHAVDRPEPARPTSLPESIPDAPMRGRLRTRGDSASSPGQAPAGPGPGAGTVRVRGRGGAGAGPSPGHHEQTGASASPGLAEQLGAGGRQSGPAPDQPDWSQRASTQGAPSWATTQGPAPGSGVDDAPSPSSSGDDVDGPPAGPPVSPPAPAPGAGRTPPTGRAGRTPDGDDPSEDDEDLATSGAVGQPVVESVLGGTVIAINDDPVA